MWLEAEKRLNLKEEFYMKTITRGKGHRSGNATNIAKAANKKMLSHINQFNSNHLDSQEGDKPQSKHQNINFDWEVVK